MNTHSEQFQEIRERLYLIRVKQINAKLRERLKSAKQCGAHIVPSHLDDAPWNRWHWEKGSRTCTGEKDGWRNGYAGLSFHAQEFKYGQFLRRIGEKALAKMVWDRLALRHKLPSPLDGI